jgi:phenylpropionate dioxygenase-like ring-hydroxylating dioxygenase large terminal subunit
VAGFEDYWYVVAESRELAADRVLGRRVLERPLACFRGADGAPTVLQDRCLHRNSPLSIGAVRNGLLTCPYHGWTYDGAGRVVSIPSMGPAAELGQCSRPFASMERDGYVYARLGRDPPAGILPFAMPHHGEAGWKTLRLQNRFAAAVADCVENFIDLPHTAFVHRGIFRDSAGERLTASVTRRGGTVHVAYRNERANLGTFRWFLNPGGDAIGHTDTFHAPNVTSVVYELGRRTFVITSQAVPVAEAETLVYTDLTYNFGALNGLAAPFVRWHGQRIIDQDLAILARQAEVIARDGRAFHDSPADTIHRFVDSIREAIARGEDPRALPEIEREIEFLV